MIEYIEIRSSTTREIIGLIDMFESVIWHSVYYGVGDFEIYASATAEHLELLQEDNYVTRQGSEEIGIIEKINIERDENGGRMITATGRFAKSILDRRLIYKLSGKVNTPTILTGNVEAAVRGLVYGNAIGCTFDTNRNISFLELGDSAGTTETIVDEDGNSTQKQVSYQNLLEYTEELLLEYELGSRIILDPDTNNLQYIVYKGADRSADNTENNEPIIFSEEYDNLLSSNYEHDSSAYKNTALIGGEGEGLERFYTIIGNTKVGLARRETWVDASSINKTYEDESSQQQTYTDAEYRKMLKAEGTQQLSLLTQTESYDGSVDINAMWQINEDYFLGDIIQIQDNALGMYIEARIIEITEVQDENGYSIDPVFDFG